MAQINEQCNVLREREQKKIESGTRLKPTGSGAIVISDHYGDAASDNDENVAAKKKKLRPVKHKQRYEG